MIAIREILTINGCWWWFGINLCLTILIFILGFYLNKNKARIGEELRGLLNFGKYGFLVTIFFAIECLVSLLGVENLREEIKIGSYSFSDGNCFVVFSIFWSSVISSAVISLLVCYLIDLKKARSQENRTEASLKGLF